jgi:hypothetical protein
LMGFLEAGQAMRMTQCTVAGHFPVALLRRLGLT